MKIPVYKSLDKPSSLFGLKGTYAFYAGGGIIVALIVAAIVSGYTNGIIGVITFVAVAAAAYLGVLRVQSSFTERQLKKFMAGKTLKNYIEVHPCRMRRYTLSDEEAEELRKK